MAKRPPYEHHGSHCWETWFIDECDQAGLFGVTKQYLEFITDEGHTPYDANTQIFLEDVPYRVYGKQKFRRICGPYTVVPLSALPPGASRVFPATGDVILYRDANPSAGPWFDRGNITRVVDGVSFSYRQTASIASYYPYRFAIRKAEDFAVELV